MPAYFALATSVGLLAVLDTWLFFGPLAATFVTGLVWVSFIAWGCHFHSGGGVKGMTTAIVCMSFGALIGMLSVLFANNVLGGLDVPVALGIAVGLGAATICLASKIPLLAGHEPGERLRLRLDRRTHGTTPRCSGGRHSADDRRDRDRCGVRHRFRISRQCADQEDAGSRRDCRSGLILSLRRGPVPRRSGLTRPQAHFARRRAGARRFPRAAPRCHERRRLVRSLLPHRAR